MNKENKFAAWFRKKLAECDKDQNQIAAECGLSRTYITMLKTASTHRKPSPGTLFMLAKSLGVSLQEAFDEARIAVPDMLVREVNYIPELSPSERVCLANIEGDQPILLTTDKRTPESIIEPLRRAGLSDVQIKNILRKLFSYCLHRELQKLLDEV